MVQEQTTRRERQREATYDEILRAARGLLAGDEELSLRAVAAAMGMTAPALYRYVASYQELVDLVAFEVDKAATETFRAAADTQPDDDPAARLVCACVAFRQWALRNPREFGLVFANPVADAGCIRREAVTISTSGHLFTDLLYDVWVKYQHPIPTLDDLPPAVREAVLEPLMPAKVERIPEAQRGLVWTYMQGWTQLYGVVALEVFGHMDPRVIESGEMFVDTIRNFAPRLSLDAELPRLVALMRERLAA